MKCPHIPLVKYVQFSERLGKQVLAERIPINGSFELTFRCNLRCTHCYCNLSANNQAAIEKELSTEKVFDIFDQIAESGCLWLLLTGGEPFLRKDFLEIYTYAKKKGLLISLYTNGTLITPEIADYLAEWPPHEVEITLYGSNQETYEKITGVPGSFKRCQIGIDLLLQRKIPLSLKTMVMNLNCGDLSKMKEYAQKLGVGFRFDPELNPRLDAGNNFNNLRLSPEEVVRLDLDDEKRANAWQDVCLRLIQPFKSDKLYVCGAGVHTFHIDPYGKMNACMLSRFESYDLHLYSFKEIWNRYIPQHLSLEAQGDYPCGKCELISLCGRCPGWAWLENGNLEAPVEYLCQIAHLRAEAFSA
ncbi:MAG: radical SAM protein [Candidatus Omnitrophota bacterium]|jgi:radical SAM protein with 4Fe4S-binding SPASM domain